MHSSTISHSSTTLITYQNVAGARSKLHAFNDILCIGTFDIVALTETHFDNTVNDIELLSGTHYSIVRRDRSASASLKSKGGGVCCILKNTYQFKEAMHFDNFLIEHLLLHVRIEMTWIIIAIIYLPPGRARLRMLNEFSTIVTQLRKEYRNEDMYFIGDFNWPMAQWIYTEATPGVLSNSFTGNGALNKFCDILAANGLFQRNHFPNSNGKILDLILSTNDCMISSGANIIGLDRVSAHHQPLEIRIKTDESAPKEEIVTSHDIKLSRTKQVFLNSQLQFIEPGHLMAAFTGNFRELDGAIESTMNQFMSIQRKCTKANVKRILPAHCKYPWTKAIEYRQAYKSKLWARTNDRAFSTDDTRMALKNAYQILYEIYNRLKTNYFAKIITEECTDTRRFYQLMRHKRKPTANLPPLMTLNGQIMSGDARITAIVASLSEIFTKKKSSFSKDQNEAHNQFSEIYTTHFNITNAAKWGDFNITFTFAEIRDALLSINPRKDPGPMGLSTRMLQYNYESVLPVLFDVLNSIVQSGFFPQSWLTSFVTPIPKAGDAANVKNYRGIAQQSVLPKLLDKLLTSRIVRHMEQFLPPEQHGFRRNSGTVSNLLEMTTFIRNGIAKGRRTDAIYFDYSKAFDTVSHRILATKLARYGMPYILYRAVMTFIAHKKMILRVNGSITNHEYEVSSGVPQGSHIGPVLFILFTADLVVKITPLGVHILKYADDTKIFAYVNCEAERIALQNGIDILVQWSKDNELELNDGKTCWMSFGVKPTSYQTYYYIGTMRLQNSSSVRDLGVYFDTKLSFKKHHEYVLDRCRKAYGASYRFALGFGDRKILLMIFNIYIRPIFEYAAVIWTGNAYTTDSKLEEVLRKTTRFVLASPHRPHMPGYISYEERLKILQQLPLRTRRTIALVTTLERIRTKKLRVSFGWQVADCFVENPEMNRLRLRYRINYSHFKAHTIIYNAMMEMNSLRYCFEHRDSIHTIKKKLYEYFNEARNE